MRNSRTIGIQLQFDPASGALRDGRKLRDGLAGVTGLRDTLWIVNDESASVERLQRTRARQPSFGGHATFRLRDYIRLPAGNDAEADLEDLDVADGYLWLTGSHASEREMPERRLSPRKVAKTLAKVARNANRCLIARIPTRARGADGGARRTREAVSMDRRRAPGR